MITSHGTCRWVLCSVEAISLVIFMKKYITLYSVTYTKWLKCLSFLSDCRYHPYTAFTLLNNFCRLGFQEEIWRLYWNLKLLHFSAAHLLRWEWLPMLILEELTQNSWSLISGVSWRLSCILCNFLNFNSTFTSLLQSS